MQLETDGVARRDDATLYERVARTLRQLFGAPDYGAYVDHCGKAGHPVRLTEKEYVKEFFERKGTQVRCC